MNKFIGSIIISGIFTFFLSMSYINVYANPNLYAYGEFETFLELEEAYYQAIENNDIERQAELIKIAQDTLNQEIQENTDSLIDINSNSRYLYHPELEAAYSKHILSSSWINRNGLISLSVYPNKPDFWSNAEKTAAWNGLAYVHMNNSHWANTNSMREQFFCHARLVYATVKQPWNLEPSKTSINPITCN